MLPKSTHCHYTDRNIKYLSIYISIAAMKWLLVQQEVGQWSGEVRARARAEMHMQVHYLLTVCTSCMLDQYSTFFSVFTLNVAHCLDTDELWFMSTNP